jgi:hypothetical protein
MQTKKMPIQFITKPQIKMIHVLKAAMKMTDPEYQDTVFEASGGKTQTSKDLTWRQARALLVQMEKNAVSMGVWKQDPNRRHPRQKYDDLKGRAPDMASPAQMRLIEALWATVSVAHAKDRPMALRHFLKNRFKVDDIRFVEKSMVQKIVKTLKTMATQDPKEA